MADSLRLRFCQHPVSEPQTVTSVGMGLGLASSPANSAPDATRVDFVSSALYADHSQAALGSDGRQGETAEAARADAYALTATCYPRFCYDEVVDAGA